MKNGDIYSKLAEKYKLHRNIIMQICNHPFIFASRRMADPDDEKTIMFHYMFKVRMKNRFKGKKREIYDKRKAKEILDKQD